MSGQLDGKVAIVTGGASGIGRGTVELFVEHGARVVIADVVADAGKALADNLGASAHFVATDVTQSDQVEALVAATAERFGRLDVMYNNAASGGDTSPLIDLSPEGLDSTLRLVVASVVYGHRFAAKQFIAQGTSGSIITTASGASFAGGWSAAAYTIGKHAVVGVVRQAAHELGRYGIRSNAVAPGMTMTPIMVKYFGLPDELALEFIDYVADALKDQQPLGRVGRPTDIAQAALFLASDSSAFMTGTVIPVDGGMTAVTQSTLIPSLAAAAESFAAAHGIARG